MGGKKLWPHLHLTSHLQTHIPPIFVASILLEQGLMKCDIFPVWCLNATNLVVISKSRMAFVNHRVRREITAFLPEPDRSYSLVWMIFCVWAKKATLMGQRAAEGEEQCLAVSLTFITFQFLKKKKIVEREPFLNDFFLIFYDKLESMLKFLRISGSAKLIEVYLISNFKQKFNVPVVCSEPQNAKKNFQLLNIRIICLPAFCAENWLIFI